MRHLPREENGSEKRVADMIRAINQFAWRGLGSASAAGRFQLYR